MKTKRYAYSKDFEKGSPFFLDGAVGSVLQNKGLQAGQMPEWWNITHKSAIIDLHKGYIAAGSNIINTNTFGAFKTKFGKDLARVIEEGLDCAKAACVGSGAYIHFDLGPTGKLLKPMGDLDFEDAVALYRATFDIALKVGGFDGFTLETFGDTYEAKAALVALSEAQEAFDVQLPVFLTFAFDKDGRTLTGADVKTVVALAEAFCVTAVGVNCSLGPKDLLSVVKDFVKFSSIPVIAKPNAGLPHDENGKVTYDLSIEDYVCQMATLIDAGAVIVGGCCGTNEKYIEALVDKCALMTCQRVLNKTFAFATSGNKCVILGQDGCTAIGERINPTGKKRFKQALRENDIDYIVNEALEQEKAGAQVLDVNVGLPEISEEQMMKSVVYAIQSVCPLPLQIDTTNPAVMAATLRRYNGVAMVNSVNGKSEVMNAVFPLVKKYGGAVVALLLDEEGIPPLAIQRIAIAQKILTRAQTFGIERKQIFFDALTMAVSSDDKAGKVTLECVASLSQMGCNTVLGVSNISFGLPQREGVTAMFLILAIREGLKAAIINIKLPAIKVALCTFDMLIAKDEHCLRYIAQINALPKPTSKETFPPTPNTTASASNENSTFDKLTQAIIKGLVNVAKEETKMLLDSGKSAQVVIDEYIMKALNYVGQEFESKRMFLPQLLIASDGAKASFEVIKQTLNSDSSDGEKVVLATVQGDIHDIGKNIVKTLLQNYGFCVIDLGKDVPPEVVVQKCLEENVKMVGLSALMTTTVGAMQKTIEMLREKGKYFVCVGGAVMTEEYAAMIGADKYCKTAMDTVRYFQSLLPKA